MSNETPVGCASSAFPGTRTARRWPSTSETGVENMEYIFHDTGKELRRIRSIV